MTECGCERGGDCTKTTVCAISSALQDQAEEYDRRIAELKAESAEMRRIAGLRREPLEQSNG